ncbi:MAG: hypothetical protein ACYSPI_06765 [Planctomycetota bacterium]
MEFSPQATSEIEEIADRIDCPFEFRCYKSRNNQSSQDADFGFRHGLCKYADALRMSKCIQVLWFPGCCGLLCNG